MDLELLIPLMTDETVLFTSFQARFPGRVMHWLLVKPLFEVLTKNLLQNLSIAPKNAHDTVSDIPTECPVVYRGPSGNTKKNVAPQFQP